MTVERRVYTLCGLRLRSDVELHLPTTPAAEWDVDVRRGPDVEDVDAEQPGAVVAELGSAESRWYTATATASGYQFRFHGCADFLVSADCATVEVREHPGGQVELVPILLAGTVGAFLLTLRGRTVLHASAVAIDGSALAFTGQSGRGKSTLAALMCVEQGAILVTDDVLTVDPGPPVTCTGGASELRLRAGATPLAEGPAGRGTRTTADQRLALALDAVPQDPLPLAAIVVPTPSRTAVEVAVTRVGSSDALFGLLALPRVYGWRVEEVLSRDFATLSQVVSQVPVYGATIPWGPPFDRSVARALSALANGDGGRADVGP